MIDIPYDKRLQLAKDFIRPGAVFSLQSSQTKPTRIKFHIILLENEGIVHYVFSNTNIWDYQRKRKEFYQLQIEAQKGTENCFKKNCFVDCARIYSKSSSEMAHNIAKSFQNFLGEISEEMRVKMKKVVQVDKKILSKIEKDYFKGL